MHPDVEWLFDRGARERERQDKLEKRQREYERFASAFLGKTKDIVEGWPIYTFEGVVRCGFLECDMAIDRKGSPDAIRFHLYQVHRKAIGVEESGEWGINQAVGCSGGNHSNCLGNSPCHRFQDKEGDSGGD